MSGRIRSIKPEILEDAITAGLSDMAFRLFIACITLADDYGRLRAEPGWLMGQVYWARTVRTEDFLEAWKELTAPADGGDPLVRAYVVTGQRYAEIRNWSKHQKVSHPGKPRVPAPPQVSADPPESLPRPYGESPATLVPDLRSPIPIPTTDHRPEPPPGVSESRPLVDVGTGEVFAAWCAGVRDGTGRNVTPLSPSDRRALVDILGVHAAELRGQALDDWVRSTAAEFVRMNQARFGFTVSRFRTWLDGGRPDGREKGPGGKFEPPAVQKATPAQDAAFAEGIAKRHAARLQKGAAGT